MPSHEDSGAWSRRLPPRHCDSEREPDSDELDDGQQNGADIELARPAGGHHGEHVERTWDDKVLAAAGHETDSEQRHHEPAGDSAQARPEKKDAEERADPDARGEGWHVEARSRWIHARQQEEVPEHEPEVRGDRDAHQHR